MHKLIIASEVVNDSSDVGQLHAMAKAAKDALEAEALQVLADQGYYSSLELKACEDDGIVAYVPVPESNAQPEKNGRFSLKDFGYDPAIDAYRCPAGELLRPMEGRWENTSGRTEIRYASSTKACRACPLRTNCLSPKASRRTIGRWEHEDVLERHRARMQGAGELMRRRSAIVEHPFGTLKCRAGYRHFLVRGLDKVRGEWSSDGTLLQLHPRPQHPRVRALCCRSGKGYSGSLLRARTAASSCVQLLLRSILDKYARRPRALDRPRSLSASRPVDRITDFRLGLVAGKSTLQLARVSPEMRGGSRSSRTLR